MAEKEYKNESDQGKDAKNKAVAGEYAPDSTLVVDVDDIEELLNNRDGSRVVVGVYRYVREYPEL